MNQSRQFRSVSDIWEGSIQFYWNQIAAAAVVVVIPTLVMVLLFQKQIVAGIANGAVKE